MLNELELKLNGCSEYDTLKQVIMCSPEYMRIDEVINKTQGENARNNINQEIAVKQHHDFVSTLMKNGVEVFLLNPKHEFPEQVFTRDIGFVIGNILFTGNMSMDIRKGETECLKEYLNNNNINYHFIKSGTIEGGDVIVDEFNKLIWVGVNNRTSLSAVNELKLICSDYKIYPIEFHTDFLHIDCTFNILSQSLALIYRPAFNDDNYKKLSSYYNLIEVDTAEQSTLATNVLSLGNKNIIGSPANIKTNKKLNLNGFNIINVDISEIIKSGGAFRCATLPVYRIKSSN